jgi:hypothetical protein
MNLAYKDLGFVSMQLLQAFLTLVMSKLTHGLKKTYTNMPNP